MKIAVLHHAARPPWTSVQLVNALLRHGVDADYIVWDYVSAEVGGGCSLLYRGRCPGYSAVIVRGLGRSLSPEQLLYRVAVLEAAEALDGVAVVNPPGPMLAARNKLTSSIALARCGLPVPRTFASENLYMALSKVKEVGRVVVKPIMGSLGLGSFLVDNVDFAYHVFNLLLEFKQPLYIQRYIEKKDNSDVRVMVVDGEAIAAIMRRARSGWKTNIAQGAEAEPLPREGWYSELAVKATECLGLVYAGVDLAEDEEGNRYVLEVNASPLWRGLYRATGVDPAPRIAEAVIRRARR